jgi:hypothetical protein
VNVGPIDIILCIGVVYAVSIWEYNQQIGVGKAWHWLIIGPLAPLIMSAGLLVFVSLALAELLNMPVQLLHRHHVSAKPIQRQL